MSDILKNALTNHIKKNAFQIQVLRATVNSYDKKSRTCNVTLDNGVEIEDILIQPISNFDKGLIVFPAKNSKVLLEKIEAQNMALRICSYTEIAEVELDLKEVSIKLDEKGLKFGNKGEDLKTVLNEYMSKMEDFMTQMSVFAEEVSKVIVVVGTTVNIPAVLKIKKEVEGIKSESKDIKNRLNKIIN